MEFITAALQWIPQAATHPYSLFAYLVVVLSWLAIQYRVQRNATLIANIEKLPAEDRLVALEAEMGTAAVRGGLSPEQWLKQKRQHYFAMGFFAILAASVLVFVIAVKESDAARSRAELTEILDGKARYFLRTLDRVIDGINRNGTTVGLVDAETKAQLAKIRNEATELFEEQRRAMSDGNFVRFYEIGNQINALSPRFGPLIEKSEVRSERLERLAKEISSMGVNSEAYANQLLEEKQLSDALEEMAQTTETMMPAPQP